METFELLRHHGAGVRAVAAEFGEPLRRVGLELGEIGAGDDRILELLGCCGQVDAKLLGNGGRLHGLGVCRGHASRVSGAGARRAPNRHQTADHRRLTSQHWRYCEHVSAEDESPRTPPRPSRPSLRAEARQLRFAYVAGVTPGNGSGAGKSGCRMFRCTPSCPTTARSSRVLRDGSADLSFVRLPVEREGLSVIPLYEEQPVVVAPKGHEISLFEEVALADLSPGDLPGRRGLGGPEMALQVVASGAGLVILPMSVARHFNVKDTVARKLTGAPATEIALAWPSDATDEVIEEFIGIVRGRTAASSRQPSAQQEKPKKEPKPDRRGTGASRSPRWPSATRPTRTRAAARDPGRRASASAAGSRSERREPRETKPASGETEAGAGVPEGLDGVRRNLVARGCDLPQRRRDLGREPRPSPRRRQGRRAVPCP